MESEPLAGPGTGVKGRNGELCHELVAHFFEWTTGWVLNLGKGQKTVNFAWNQAELKIILLEKGK